MPWKIYVNADRKIARKVTCEFGPITQQRDRSRESQRSYSYISLVTELQVYGQHSKLKINIIRILTFCL